MNRGISSSSFNGRKRYVLSSYYPSPPVLSSQRKVSEEDMQQSSNSHHHHNELDISSSSCSSTNSHDDSISNRCKVIKSQQQQQSSSTLKRRAQSVCLVDLVVSSDHDNSDDDNHNNNVGVIRQRVVSPNTTTTTTLHDCMNRTSDKSMLNDGASSPTWGQFFTSDTMIGHHQQYDNDYDDNNDDDADKTNYCYVSNPFHATLLRNNDDNNHKEEWDWDTAAHSTTFVPMYRPEPIIQQRQSQYHPHNTWSCTSTGPERYDYYSNSHYQYGIYPEQKRQRIVSPQRISSLLQMQQQQRPTNCINQHNNNSSSSSDVIKNQQIGSQIGTTKAVFDDCDNNFVLQVPNIDTTTEQLSLLGL